MKANTLVLILAIILSFTMVSSLMPSAFALSSDINLPSSLTSIGDEAFAGDSAIEIVNIPASVEEIGIDAFSDTNAGLIANNDYVIDYAKDYSLDYYIPVQDANFPDSSFRSFIAQHYDTSPADGYLSGTELASVTEMDVSSQGISSLTGIESFFSLQKLNCSDNALRELKLDFSPLLELDCSDNQLSTLDLGSESPIEMLTCSNNRLTSLDLRFMRTLQTVDCQSNLLTEILLSDNHALCELYCGDNSLHALDLSWSPAIYTLVCWGNSISTLDVNANFYLYTLMREASPNTGTFSNRPDTYTYYLKSDNFVPGGLIYLAVPNDTVITGAGYHVTYNANGGMFASNNASSIISPEQQRNAQYTVISEVPDRDGCSFVGWMWNGDENDLMNPGDTFYIADDVELVAKWHLPQPTAVTVQASNLRPYTADKVTFTYSVEGIETSQIVSAEWQVKTGDTWTTIGTQNSYAPFVTVIQNDVDSYYRVIVNGVESDNDVLLDPYETDLRLSPRRQAVTAGNSASFSCSLPRYGWSADSYQWQCRTDADADWADIDGANENRLAIDSTTLSMSGWQYRCIAFINGVRLESDAAVLAVYNTFKITGQPQNALVNESEDATFSVSTSWDSEDCSYYWQYREPDSTSWHDIYEGYLSYEESAAGNQFQLKIYGSIYARGYSFRCKVSSAEGVTKTSKAVICKYYPESISLWYTTGGADKESMRVGSSVTIKATVYPEDVIDTELIWTSSDPSVISLSDQTVSMSDTGCLQSEVTMTALSEGTATVTAAAASNGYSNSVTFRASPVLITKQVRNQWKKAGTTAIFTIEAEGASSYQWQKSTDGGASWVNAGTGRNLQVSSDDESIKYRCIVSGAGGTSVTSAEASVIVVRIFSQDTFVHNSSGTQVSLYDNYATLSVSTNSSGSWYQSKNGTTWDYVNGYNSLAHVSGETISFRTSLKYTDTTYNWSDFSGTYYRYTIYDNQNHEVSSEPVLFTVR